LLSFNEEAQYIGPFVRSQSESQLKVDSASNKETAEKLKSKPPPLEIKTVRSCENFSRLSGTSV
jgi:hypothetical protein